MNLNNNTEKHIIITTMNNCCGQLFVNNLSWSYLSVIELGQHKPKNYNKLSILQSLINSWRKFYFIEKS